MKMNFKKSLPYVEVIEQPTKTLRFRYECEGRSAGNIPGANSTLENKTCPSIRVIGYKGRAIVVASCVTKDKPYRPHPHNLIGREGCKKGVCTNEIPSEDMTVTFSNLGIMCVKRKDIRRELKIREEIRVDPFQTGFEFKRDSVDLNSVRLCFQVFLEGSQKGKFNVPLPPVVSDPIFDKKIIPDLMICELSHYSASVAGGMNMILLCEKVVKDDIQIRFFEEKNGKVVWEGFGDFQPAHVHKQVSIRFKTSSYHTQEIEEPVPVHIQLKRPSDGALSEPLPFLMLPLSPDDPNSLRRKKRKINNNNLNMVLKKETEIENKSSEVAPFQCSLGNEELFPLRALEIISKQPRFNIQTIRAEVSPTENNPTLIQSSRPSPQYSLTNGDAQVSIDLYPKEQFSCIHDMLQIQPEEHLTLTKVTSESRYEEFHLSENTGKAEETNGTNILDMDSLECDFDSNLLKIDSEELYNFDIENLSENLSNILSISDITKLNESLNEEQEQTQKKR
ncbi:embryonic polarity protein dorsal-like isoform X2 [Apis florea]|uniref:embryonic polarity protein dorsal-like isoform X2 n=1 Tax=Apis florea TaxID=7463 RepID=UPI0012FE937D|nr:embryonic polarity protein dorsal-like isoform X2 [Apis florea]